MLSISASVSMDPAEKVMIGVTGVAFAHRGCPWCAASLLFPQTICPTHTLPPYPFLHGIGLVSDAGHISIAILPSDVGKVATTPNVESQQGGARTAVVIL